MYSHALPFSVSSLGLCGESTLWGFNLFKASIFTSFHLFRQETTLQRMNQFVLKMEMRQMLWHNMHPTGRLFSSCGYNSSYCKQCWSFLPSLWHRRMWCSMSGTVSSRWFNKRAERVNELLFVQDNIAWSISKLLVLGCLVLWCSDLVQILYFRYTV